MTKILITGGCGFIGSNLTEYLLEKTDWKIIILDNLSTGRLKDIKTLKGFNNVVTFFKGDIIKTKDINKAINNCDYLVNLAAQTSVLDSINDPLYDENVNIQGILNLLRLSVKNKVKKFIQASSAAAVGEQEMPMNESKVPKPISPYGASKLSGEAYCSAFSRSYGLNSIVLRFSNVYGPKSYNKGSAIVKFIKKILKGEKLEVYGDGEQTRDFIYVKDICSGIYKSVIKDTNEFELIQLGTGIETSINTLIQLLMDLLEKFNLNKPEVIYTEQRPGEIVRNYCDISKAKNILDFTINMSLEKGLTNTIKWFKTEFSNS